MRLETYRVMKRFLPLILLAALIFVVTLPADAQCAMCTKAAMDGIKDGNTTSMGINDAILVLLAMPYILAGSIAAMWFYKRRQAKLAV